jgi:spore germination protein YaaH
MKKETRIAISLISVGIILALSATLIKNIKTKNFISPFSNSFSVFAMLKPHKRPNYTVYGFMPYWSLVDMDYLQLDKLTDIAYFGLYINKDGTIRKIMDDGTTEPGYNNWENSDNLKKIIGTSRFYGINMSVTVMSHEAETSDYFLSCEACWKTLANALVTEMDKKGIKDINLNFEYADLTDGDTADKYTKLVDYMNKTLDAKYGNSKVIVSTFADSFVKKRVTKPTDLARVSDGLFVMAYDFHQPSSDNAGPVAPINGIGKISEYDLQTMLNDYLTSVPPEKIIMGVPYYGYNWIVTDSNPNAARIPGNDFIGVSQSQPYQNIMDTILETKAAIIWDELAQSPYFNYISPKTGMSRQVYFENAESLKAKYELAKRYNLAGIGIWALGYDGGYQELWNLLKEEFIL